MSHARVYGSPGERPRLAGLLRAMWPVFVVVAVAGGLLQSVLPFPEIGSTTAGLLFLLLAAAFAVAVATSRGRVESYLKGARGEEWVAHELSFLPAAYTAFHGVPRSSRSIMGRAGDLDHVVVGPTGVFIIETKNWDGSITVEDNRILYDGRKPSRPPLEQVRDAASDLRSKLQEAADTEIRPRPIVCFAGDTVRGDRQTADGVVVCNVRVLNDLITEPAGQPLPEQARTRIALCLRRMLDQ